MHQLNEHDCFQGMDFPRYGIGWERPFNEQRTDGVLQHFISLRARYFDSGAGRFASEDPLLFAAGPNFYRYAANNPIRFLDPSGMCIIELFVVPTGEHSDGFFLHSFLVLIDNSSGGRGRSPMVFRGGPGTGVPPLIDANLMPLNRLTSDQPKDSVYSSTLLHNDCSCSSYLSRLNHLISEIDKSKIPYDYYYNSNSVTSDGIRTLGLPLPNIPFAIWPNLISPKMPGWDHPLPLLQPLGGGSGNAF